MVVYAFVRPVELGDEEQIKKLQVKATFETFWTLVWTTYFSELSLQCIILGSALLFILINVPLYLCWISIPGMLVIFTFLLYANYLTDVKRVKKELNNVMQTFTEEDKCGFWVVEAWEEIGKEKEERVEVEMIREEVDRVGIMKIIVTRGLLDRCRRLGVVGTVGLTVKVDHNKKEPPRSVGLLSHLLVLPHLRHRGLAQELLARAMKHALEVRYRALEVFVRGEQEGGVKFLESADWGQVDNKEERILLGVNRRVALYRKAIVSSQCKDDLSYRPE